MEQAEQAGESGGEVQGSGVTEASQTPSQEQSQETATEETSAEAQEEGRIPMSRWNQKLKAERELKAQLKQYEQRFGESKQAIDFYNALKSDPGKLEQVLRILNGRQEQETKEPDYSQYDPDVAERFRKLDQLEKWKAELERREQDREYRSVESHKLALEEDFENYLKADGLIDNDGNYDEDRVKLISRATLAMMAEIAQNPDMPTKSELKKAYDLVNRGLSSWSKSTLTKVVKSNVPPTGSKAGVPLTGGGKMTEAQRIAQIANEL